MRIDIAVCTFRRDFLFNTLKSLESLVVPDNASLRVIIADNDTRDHIRRRIDAFSEGFPYAIEYIHAPSKNISIARNACLEFSEADYLCFLDDDELARPDWVEELLRVQSTSGAGVVLGPVAANYPPEAPAWMVANDFHSTRPHDDGNIATGHCGNVLLDLCDPRIKGRRFDLSYGRTGGEDVDFFFQLHREGVRIVLAESACIDEPVTPERLSAKWLLKRRHRTGKIFGYCCLSVQRPSRALAFAEFTAKAVYCGVRAGAVLPSRRRSAYWLMRGSFHLGVVSGLISRPHRELYGN